MADIITQMNRLKNSLEETPYVNLANLTKADAKLFLAMLEITNSLLPFITKWYPKYLSRSKKEVLSFHMLDDFNLI